MYLLCIYCFIKVIQGFSMVSFVKEFNTKYIYVLHHSDLDNMIFFNSFPTLKTKNQSRQSMNYLFVYNIVAP